MKKLIATLTCALAIFSGCSITELNNEQLESVTPRLSIDEAKAAFEDTYLTALTKTGNSTGGKANKLTTGDFTPLWDKASYSENGKACSYDVNLIAERKVYAAVAKFENGHASAEKVRVYQRLVVIKNDCYPRACCYMLSLIPDCGCDGGERMAEQFRSCADKGLFSGLAVYSTLSSQAIIRVDRYCNGVRKDGVYIPDGKGAYRQRLEKAAGMLSGISFFNRKNITTKSFGEDFWDDDDDYGWDYGDSDDYTSVGGGFYEDSDGNLYYDTDNDGMPDSMVINGSVCTPDFDDSYLWNPYPDNNESSNTGNGSYDDGGYFGGNIGSGNGNKGNNPQKDENTQRGKEGIQKISKDISEGKVVLRKIADGTLLGAGVGINANSILYSAAQFVQELNDINVIKSFGKALGLSGIAVTGAQTIIVLLNGEELTTSDIVSIVSAALGGCALIPGLFPVVSGVLGISSAVIGIVSIFITEGLYAIEAPNGEQIYVYISAPMYNTI